MPLPAGKMVVDFLEGDFLNNLHLVRVPFLAVHSTRDHISDYRVVHDYLNKIASEKKHAIFVDKTNHVLEYNGLILIKYFFDFVSFECIMESSADRVSRTYDQDL